MVLPAVALAFVVVGGGVAFAYKSFIGDKIDQVLGGMRVGQVQRGSDIPSR